jgi:inosine-uridine nucleoside N-ribohydrolase
MNSNRRDFMELCGGAFMAGMLSRPAAALRTVAREQENGPRKGPRKVIIDTDPGVDDAFALFLAMRSPELEVKAVTAVAGNVPLDVTLPNALRLVEIAGRTDIPVAGGASAPLVRKLVTAAYAHGNNGLADVDFPAPKLQPVKEPAADLISRLVRENAGEISIVGLGPLTNVALALHQDPEIASQVESIVLMGGSTSGGNVTPSAEFNFYVDPEAASMVFDSGIPIRMIGLNVTRKTHLTEEHVNTLRAGSGPVSQAAARIATAVMKMYLEHGASGGPSLHDPLALSCLIRPDILTFEDDHVEIETTGSITAGESVCWKHAPLWYSPPLNAVSAPASAVDPPFRSNAKVAVDVDSNKFFDLLIPRLAAARA